MDHVPTKGHHSPEGEAWKDEGGEGCQEHEEQTGQTPSRNAVMVPGRNGGRLMPPWSKGNHPRGGRPAGVPDAWSDLCRLRGENAQEWAAKIDDILAHPEKYPKVYGVVLKEYGERILGPVERRVEHSSTSARVVIHGLAVPQGAPDPQALPEVAKGPTSGDPESVGRALGPPQLPGATVPSQSVGGSFGSHAPPASSGALEARMAGLESQVGELMSMMKALIERGG